MTSIRLQKQDCLGRYDVLCGQQLLGVVVKREASRLGTWWVAYGGGVRHREMTRLSEHATRKAAVQAVVDAAR